MFWMLTPRLQLGSYPKDVLFEAKSHFLNILRAKPENYVVVSMADCYLHSELLEDLSALGSRAFDAPASVLARFLSDA